MKLPYLTPIAYTALLLGCALANAQTAPNTPSGQPETTQKTTPGYDTAKGNDLDTTSKSPQVDASSAPPSAGQDKSTGNDMVSPNGTAKESNMKLANAARPDFNTLDTKKKGTLTAADVKSDKWLSKNFAKCDTDHDGTLSRDEYDNCH